MSAAAPDDVFRAVADPTRRALLELLRERDRSVAELTRPFSISQPAVSQHLKVLREAGLVRARRDGRLRVYELERGPLEGVQDWVARYLSDPGGHVWRLSSARRRGFSKKKEEEDHGNRGRTAE